MYYGLKGFLKCSAVSSVQRVVINNVIYFEGKPT